MTKKARKKATAKRKQKTKLATGKKARVMAKSKARAARKKKSRLAPKKKTQARKAKPKTIGEQVSGAFRAVVDTVAEAHALRNKLEQPGSSESE